MLGSLLYVACYEWLDVVVVVFFFSVKAMTDELPKQVFEVDEDDEKTDEVCTLEIFIERDGYSKR